MKIRKDKEGKYKRVYVEFSIVNRSLLREIQNEIAKQISIDLIPLDDLHLTLFHFGKPESIYNDLLKANKDLRYKDFLESFLHLIADIRCIELKSLSFDLHSERLHLRFHMFPSEYDMFGDDIQNILVLKFKRNSELLLFRKRIMKRFKVFLKENGVKDIPLFMKNSPNFKYQLRYQPHISLGVLMKEYDISNINIRDVSLILSNMVIANVG